jgi:hypothetical protein
MLQKTITAIPSSGKRVREVESPKPTPGVKTTQCPLCWQMKQPNPVTGVRGDASAREEKRPWLLNL